MSKGIQTIGGFTVFAIAVCGCDTVPTVDETRKIAPTSSFQYRLEVDTDSLPAGVSVYERRVPGTGQVQTWIRNASETPFVILSVNRQGNVIRRQKIVGGSVYLEAPARQPATGKSDGREWQVVDGIEQVLLSLNYTPGAIVRGRSLAAGEGVEVPPPEPFSISATFGNEQRPIRGRIIYSYRQSD